MPVPVLNRPVPAYAMEQVLRNSRHDSPAVQFLIDQSEPLKRAIQAGKTVDFTVRVTPGGRTEDQFFETVSVAAPDGDLNSFVSAWWDELRQLVNRAGSDSAFTVTNGETEDDFRVTLGDRVRALLRQFPSQKALAESLGVHPSTVRRWKNSQVEAPATTNPGEASALARKLSSKFPALDYHTLRRRERYYFRERVHAGRIEGAARIGLQG